VIGFPIVSRSSPLPQSREKIRSNPENRLPDRP
jgi:hypothetical protein